MRRGRSAGRVWRGFPGWGSLRRFFLVPGRGRPALLSAALCLSGCELQRLPPRQVDEGRADSAGTAAAIQSMLHSSAQDWNDGNLDGYMDDYWRSPDLTFSGAVGVTRGWDEVRDRYYRSYFAPAASRDHLRFEDIEVSLMGADHALALGRYVLSRSDGTGVTTSSGHFSLVLRWMSGGWRIIHDHTSTTPPGVGAGGS